MRLVALGGVSPGVVAIGPQATGIFAFGQFATGVLAFGQAATGVVAIGQLSRGGIAIGQLALGIVSVGQLALGVLWTGGIGVSAVGGPGLVLGLFGWWRKGRLHSTWHETRGDAGGRPPGSAPRGDRVPLAPLHLLAATSGTIAFAGLWWIFVGHALTGVLH